MPNSAWDKQTIPPVPYAWIQWKNTNVGMDFLCSCGYQGYVQGSFGYHVKCPKCKQVFFCNGHIELIPIDENEAKEHESSTLEDRDYEESNVVEEWVRGFGK